MAKSQDQTASYMMLLRLGDFASKILIPAKFVRKYEEIDRQVSVTLENDSGKSWDVKLKRMNGDLYMTDGWPEFVKENGIIEPDFLTFRLLMLPRSFNFKVSIYRVDECIKRSGDEDVEDILHENVNKNVNGGVSGIKRERGRPSKFHAGGEDVEILHKNVIKRGRGRPSKIRAGGEDVEILHKNVIKRGRRGKPFKIRRGRRSKASNDVVNYNKPVYLDICLKGAQKSRVALPAAFWRVGGMRGRRDVTMEYVATGDRKTVVLDHLKHRTDLARGWPEFRKANGIAVGKTYSFEFNPNRHVICVKELVN